MDDIAGPRASRMVTIEDAARYEDGPDAFARVTAGQRFVAFPRVVFADGRFADMTPGQVAVRFAPGDCGVMDDGEYQRWFGAA